MIYERDRFKKRKRNNDVKSVSGAGHVRKLTCEIEQHNSVCKRINGGLVLGIPLERLANHPGNEIVLPKNVNNSTRHDVSTRTHRFLPSICGIGFLALHIFNPFFDKRFQVFHCDSGMPAVGHGSEPRNCSN